MTEANLDLQPSCPSYQSHKQVYCLHSLRSVHNFRKYTYLAMLGATLSVAEFDKVCTQFEENPAVHLPRQHRTLGTAFISYMCGMRSIHNSRKTQLYTYKVCESMLPHIVILHAKTAIYQLKQALVFLHIVILHTILRKASHENTVFINCTQLQGFPIDSHTFAQVRRMIKIWHTMRW